MDKTLREVFTKIVGLVGIFLFISLYFDDYSRYSPREITQAGIPLIMSGDSTEVKLQKLEKYADVVQQHCRELRARGLYKYEEGDPDAADNAYLMVSDKYKFMACKAAGIAGTNVHRLVYALQNDLKDANIVTSTIAKKQTSDLMLNTFDEKEKLKKLKQYTKLMVIRDPLERLLSAYRAEQPTSLWSGPIKPSFKKYLSEYLAAEHPMVHPWREVWKLCNPCEIRYDYIVPLTAFNTAIPAILSHLRAPNITIPTRERTDYKTKSSNEVAKQTYNKKFPQHLKQNLQEKCKIDYFLFHGQSYFSGVNVFAH